MELVTFSIGEYEHLKVKNAQLELTLVKERAQRALDDADRAVQNAVRAAFANTRPDENCSIDNYSFDMAKGEFVPKEQERTEQPS